MATGWHMEYFVAKDYWTGWILADSTTYSIHHYDGNWTTKFQQERDQLKYQYYKKLSYLFPDKITDFIIGKMAQLVLLYRKDGIYPVLNKMVNTNHRKGEWKL